MLKNFIFMFLRMFFIKKVGKKNEKLNNYYSSNIFQINKEKKGRIFVFESYNTNPQGFVNVL